MAGGTLRLTKSAGGVQGSISRARFGADDVLAGGQSFQSFSALKRHLGSPGKGKDGFTREFHHIVEQRTANTNRFGTNRIQNTKMLLF